MIEIPRATRMVVHVRGLEPIEVDGLRWEPDRACWVSDVEAFDAEGRHLWTRHFDQGLFPGYVIVMPAELRTVEH